VIWIDWALGLPHSLIHLNNLIGRRQPLALYANQATLQNLESAVSSTREMIAPLGAILIAGLSRKGQRAYRMERP
jgi:hypothetical protein